MKNLGIIVASASAGFLFAICMLGSPHGARAGGQQADCSSENGDVNADGGLNIADAVTILGHLFQGSPTQLVPLCAAQPSASKLPSTGQTTCWTFDAELALWVEAPCGEASCIGQDGSRSEGCRSEARFIDHGDGTVSDACTGLMWLKDTADVTPDGQIDALGDSLAWCEAVTYCELLEFAGHDDWRLPDVRELQSIVDYGRLEPSIDPVFEALPQYYWSATTFLETPDQAWGVGFTNGYVGVRQKVGDFKFSFNFVRAVRSER